MGQSSAGFTPNGALSLLVFGATMAVHLHARGIQVATQGVTSDISTPTDISLSAAVAAAAAAAAQQPPHSHLTAQLLRPLSQLDALEVRAPSIRLMSSQGTVDTRVLATIPLLLSPQRCIIHLTAADTAPLISNTTPIKGRPKAVSAARAAKLTAIHLQRQQQQAAIRAAGFDAVPGVYADLLAQHNTYRTRHQAPALQWDEALAAGAAVYAARCVFEHDAAATSGESLYAAPATGGVAASLASAMQLWYNEVQLYDWNDPGYSASTGHFTQLVWKSSTSLGCAAQVCSSGITNTPFSTGGTIIICRYSPPGNILGAAQFERNVLTVPTLPPPPQSSPPAGLPDPVPAATLPEGHDFVSPGCLESSTGVFWLCMQNDGNVVLFHDKQPVWASNTANRSAFRPFKLTMQKDGNLVASDNLRQKVWMSSTAGQGAAPYRLVVQEEGNVAIFGASSTPLWSTDTAGLRAQQVQASALAP